MTIILFLVVLAVLIFAHELGHFLVAKKSGIRVDEFAIGFPPKIFSWVRGETKYVLNLIPFGGYVKIFGENPDEESMTGSDSRRSFVNAPKWKQACVLLAGISFNIIFAWILISISFMFGSIVPIGEGSAQYSKYITNERVIVTQIMPGTPAAEAGLATGDSILKITSGKESFELPNVQKIQEVITGTHGSIVLVYKRGDVEKTEVLVPKEIDGKKVVGIYMENVGVVKLNLFLALWEGGKLTLLTFKQVIVGLATFISQTIRGHGDFTQVSGPVGIVNMVGDAATFGLAYFLGFVAFISLNLAAINLVPFPALDGGRVLFVLIEAIIRRPIKPKIANTVNAVGFFILISLMIIITYRDIMKFF